MYKRNKRKPAPPMAEDFRIEIDKVFREFLNDSEITEFNFPTNLSNLQRKYIHERCLALGLKSKSYGVEPNRSIKISKKAKADMQMYCNLSFREVTNNALNELVKLCASFDLKKNPYKKFGKEVNSHKTSNEVPIVPNMPPSDPFQEFRMSLPIYSLKSSILQMLESNQVLIISAETGSGKTTQVPQYLLENASCLQKPCRIICTQPRRLSTVAVAERVASERGENLGHTVGYQIKLESKLSPDTSLIYCTNGVLLRKLISLNNNFDSITHVVVDEIHERDKYTDFLLICLKEQLQKTPNLRVILMSASMDIDLLMNYFPGAQKITSPGRLFSITDVYLDEILNSINYESNAMNVLKKKRLRDAASTAPEPEVEVEPDTVDEENNEDMNEAITDCVNLGSEDSFAQIMQLIISEEISVNYQKQDDGYTPLIAAALHGRLDIVEQLLVMGADVKKTTKDGITCNSAAKSNGHEATWDFLEAYLKVKDVPISVNEPQENLLKLYYETVFDDRVDYNLIKELIIYIHEKVDKAGGILVFLPGYDDILTCHEYLATSSLKMDEVEIFMLHGSMQIGAQHRVFKKLYNKQKIILSTNVAETSITIDDICYVIDSGRAKEKCYDASTNTHSLSNTWISKACVKQRSGRAGRTRNGICFHLFSKLRLEAMLDNTTPEILRVPLEELCLQTKAFAPPSMNIATFLSLALEPPAPISIQKAIQSLVLLGALDEEEKLTTLGKHLLQLSVLPHLGKILIYGVIFKCLDPILTIVASLNQKDPFILPTNQSDKARASIMRRELCENTFSDHMGFLRAFQKWQEAKAQQRDYKFCKDYFVSTSAMVTIMQTRNQLLGQLRSQGFINHTCTIEDVNTYSESWPIIKAALLSGIYPQLAFLDNGILSTRKEKKVICHISSSIQKNVLNSKTARGSWFMFDELSKIGVSSCMKCITIITPATVSLLGGKVTNAEKELVIDDWISFDVNNKNMIFLRSAIDKMINDKIDNPSYVRKEFNFILITVNTLLLDEDVSAGFYQPRGIGQNQNKNQYQHSPRGNFNKNYKREHMHHYKQDYANNYKREYINIQNAGYNNRGGKKYNNYQRRNEPHSSTSDSQYQQQQSVDSCPVKFNKPNIKLTPDTKYLYICDNISGGTYIGPNINLRLDTEKKVQEFIQDNKQVILFLSPKNSGYFIGAAKVTEMSSDCSCKLRWLSKSKIFFSDIRARTNKTLKLYKEGEEMDASLGEQMASVMMNLK